MQCEVCDTEEAAFTIIPTGEGMPQSLGPACFARSGLELAKAILPPEEIAQTLGPMFVTPGRVEALAKPGKRGKATEPRAETVEEAKEEPAGETAEEPAAAADA